MNKKNKPFFGTNISEEDMKDSGLFISENTEPIGLSTWEQVKLETNWDQKEKEWDEWMLKFRIRNQKGMKRASVVGVFVGIFAWAWNYSVAVTAFRTIDSSYSDNANFFIGVGGVGFALLAGFAAYTVITSTFNWFEARKKLKELDS